MLATMSMPPTSDIQGSGDDPLATLRHHLGRLHLRAGKPSSREISRRTMRTISHTTVRAVLRCESIPKWGPLELVVEALKGDIEQFLGLWTAVEDARSVIDVTGRPGETGKAEHVAEPAEVDVEEEEPRQRLPTARPSDILSAPSPTPSTETFPPTKEQDSTRSWQTTGKNSSSKEDLAAENAELRRQIGELRAQLRAANDTSTDKLYRDIPLGHVNRIRLVEQFFSSRYPVTPEGAWRNIYRLLLWIDPSSGLASCYESDKCQPGRPWYAKSLAFHTWLARELGVPPRDLGSEIDVLFSWTMPYAMSKQELSRTISGPRGRSNTFEAAPFPGEDPRLIDFVSRELEPWLRGSLPEGHLRALTASIRLRISYEKKRSVLLGEGFQDVLGAILQGIPKIRQSYDVRVRSLPHDLPGFLPAKRPRGGRVVDLALARKSNGNPTIVACAWSLRADRDVRFVDDLTALSGLRAGREPLSYVLLTNEFDPSRLAAVCERTFAGRPLFQAVVHINPAALLAAYDHPSRPGGSTARAKEYITDGRIRSLEAWLNELSVST
ncbi:hypothetical protein ACN26Y_28815 [Micromonospora sp. WMMD558]|uniref:hypothetical protein n=1 Tax=Micromonospora sp. WMMD558 TaxID=3403462 RepID=UPI003BF613FE